MYPLRFQPLFQRYLWGGQRLNTVLNKPIGEANASESWEVVDHRDGQSIVSEGPLAGKSLHELVVEFDRDLVGDRVWQQIMDPSLPESLKLRFPLLFKFLDANRNLSVQVHPDNVMAATLDPPDLGKTEAWVVVEAEPGSQIYAGIKPGVTRQQFAAAIESGQVEACLHSFEPRVGDTVFIEAGTIHAIGSGLLIAEIQQSSNTTFRVFDWNRVDQQGVSRPLHIEQALAATRFDRGPVVASLGTRMSDSVQTLVQCDQFSVERWSVERPVEIPCRGEFRIVTCLHGEAAVAGDPGNRTLKKGETMLLPACLETVRIEPVAKQLSSQPAQPQPSQLASLLVIRG